MSKIFQQPMAADMGSYEGVYNNMPRFGLANAGVHIPAMGNHKTASGRIGNQ